MKVGVVLSGGQAPGGHNVIAGLYDYVKKISPQSTMIGFCDGPHGVMTGRYVEMDDDFVDSYRNSGGFDMIGSGRHKIEKPDQFAAAMKFCSELDLDGLVIIGGDDSNTNAAILAEYFSANNCKTRVCGCPKTIDGDLKVDPYIPVSFGFDTACRTYSELIGNLGNDVLSSQKYYHFVRLMGRSASHIALECALQTRPNACIICEEVEQKKQTLQMITQQIVDIVCKRSDVGRNYGIVLLPEGLIEFIPEFNHLIAEINDILATGVESTEDAVAAKLSASNAKVFSYLPNSIKQQLLMDRDPHGNVQVAKIETEKLLAQTVAAELEKKEQKGEFKGKFRPQFHAYGYEGRSGLPSEFDATYCYVLGQNVGALLSLGQTGLISSVTNLVAPVADWKCGGVPITMMCNMEKRHGHMKPVIKKALVELSGKPFECFASQRGAWAQYDLYRSPGPLQFGEGGLELSITLSLELLGKDHRMVISTLDKMMQKQDDLVSTRKGRFIICPHDQARLSEVQVKRSRIIPKLCPHNDVPIGKQQRNKLSNFGILFCGRQAPGGHDIIAGLFDYVKSTPGQRKIYGFIGGSSGLINGHYIELCDEMLSCYRGQGGFDLLGRHTDEIHSPMFAKAVAMCKSLGIGTLVLVGSTRTCADAVALDIYCHSNKEQLNIIVAPADINNSLKSPLLEQTIGFDTCSKVCAQIVGNNSTDGGSAKKYYYFMRIIGHLTSHTTLEVALLTKPNYAILSEEVTAQQMTLTDIVNSIADVITIRANEGKNYGTVLIPEGLILVIPEMKGLIQSIDIAHDTLVNDKADINVEAIKALLPEWNKALLDTLPDFLVSQLLLERCTDGSLQCAQVETERLLGHFVSEELKSRKAAGIYKGSTSSVNQFLGYQARGAMPTCFDSSLAYNTGACAGKLADNGCSGYIATIRNLATEDVSKWVASGFPIANILTSKPTCLRLPVKDEKVVKATVVNLEGAAYKKFAAQRAMWSLDDDYENPGPIQFTGPASSINSPSLTLA